MSQWTPLVTCVNGQYEPSKPSQFICEPAVALLVSKLGEIEVFSSDVKCNQKLNNIPKANFDGHTVNLLDNKLILGALASSPSQDSWSYLSLEDPRGGLLANKWTHITTMTQESPRHHTSFVHGKDLVFLGGKDNIQTKLRNGRVESGEWNVFTLLWKNGTEFRNFKSSSCQVKIETNMVLVIGGHNSIGSQPASAKVVSVDMKEQSVQEKRTYGMPELTIHVLALMGIRFSYLGVYLEDYMGKVWKLFRLSCMMSPRGYQKS